MWFLEDIKTKVDDIKRSRNISHKWQAHIRDFWPVNIETWKQKEEDCASSPETWPPERNEECTGHWSTQREWVFNLDSRRFAYISLKNIDNLDYRTFPLVMPINSNRQLATCEVLVASVVFNSVTLLWYSSQKVQWHTSILHPMTLWKSSDSSIRSLSNYCVAVTILLQPWD